MKRVESVQGWKALGCDRGTVFCKKLKFVDTLYLEMSYDLTSTSDYIVIFESELSSAFSCFLHLFSLVHGQKAHIKRNS